MSKVVDIPGGKATIRERDELSVGQKRLIRAAAMAASPVLGRMPVEAIEMAASKEVEKQQQAERLMESFTLTRQEAMTLMEMQDAAIVACLASWTLPRALPNMDTIGDLDETLYDALAEATKQQGALTALAAEENFEVHPDPDRPTSGSGGSNGRSKATRTSKSRSISPTTIASTPSAV